VPPHELNAREPAAIPRTASIRASFLRSATPPITSPAIGKLTSKPYKESVPPERPFNMEAEYKFVETVSLELTGPEPGVTTLGEKLQVTPSGRLVQASDTFRLKVPNFGETVIFELPVPPWLMVINDGDEARPMLADSGTGVGGTGCFGLGLGGPGGVGPGGVGTGGPGDPPQLGEYATGPVM